MSNDFLKMSWLATHHRLKWPKLFAHMSNFTKYNIHGEHRGIESYILNFMYIQYLLDFHTINIYHEYIQWAKDHALAFTRATLLVSMKTTKHAIGWKATNSTIKV
jgi:hypothetical protein